MADHDDIGIGGFLSLSALTLETTPITENKDSDHTLRQNITLQDTKVFSS